MPDIVSLRNGDGVFHSRPCEHIGCFVSGEQPMLVAMQHAHLPVQTDQRKMVLHHVTHYLKIAAHSAMLFRCNPSSSVNSSIWSM